MVTRYAILLLLTAGCAAPTVDVQGGPASRWALGGEMTYTVEPVDVGWPFRLHVDFPSDGKLQYGLYVPFATYDVRVKHTEMYWVERSIGGGARILYPYSDAGKVYLQGDIAYVRWFGREDDRLTHPDMEKFLFHDDGFGRVEPKDLEGSHVGAGVGATHSVSDVLGFSLEVNYRLQQGVAKFTGSWIETALGVRLRF